MNELAHFNRAKHELALATKVDEVKVIRDKAEALRAYAKQAGESLEMQNNCAEIKIRAERRAGQLLDKQEKHKGGNPNLLQDATGCPQKLSELGINRTQSSRWQQIADVPEGEFEKHITEVRQSGDELTSVGIQQLARKLDKRTSPSTEWLKVYDIWNFSGRDGYFGQDYPGNIPAGIVLNTIHYFTDENDLVVDPMAGGGVTIDCCKHLNRKCLAYDIQPPRTDIALNDIRNGYPAEAFGCNLIFLDPPYYKKKESAYGKLSISRLGKNEYLNVFASIASSSLDVINETGRLALLMEPYINYKDYHESIWLYHYIERFVRVGWNVERIFDVPESTQRYAAYDVDRAKKQSQILTLRRQLVVFKNEK